jgi:hypothetical protein
MIKKIVSVNRKKGPLSILEVLSFGFRVLSSDAPNSKPETQNPKLKTQNSKPTSTFFSKR